MKLQEASKREVKRIGLGSTVLLLLMLAAFFVLSLLGVGTFDWRTLVSGLIGTALAVLCFMLLCLTIQSAAGMENGKPMKAKVQLGYNLRLLLQAGWVVAAFAAPVFQVLPAAIPLLFPTVILWYLQIKGRLVQPEKPDSFEA